MAKRNKLFFILVFLLLAVAVARMLQLAGSGGNTYRQEGSRLSSRTGELPAIRGRIFDRSDQLLAWSERCYDLVIKKPCAAPRQAHLLQQELKDFFNYTLDTADTVFPRTIKYNLTAAELEKADQLAEKFPELDVELRWERRHKYFTPSLGEVHQTDNCEVGISGWEKTFDHILRGKPGKFTVMLDRHGRWVNSTFRITAAAVNGEDLFLSEELEDDQ